MSKRLLCSSCLKKKPCSDFNKNKAQKSFNRGHSYYCKSCDSKIHKKIYDKTKYQLHTKPARFWAYMCNNAQRRGLPVTFSKTEFFSWLENQEKVCVYCGINQELAQLMFNARLNLDRMDSDKGYSPDNLVLACQRCNQVKSQWLTFEQMKSVAQLLFIPKSVKSQ